MARVHKSLWAWLLVWLFLTGFAKTKIDQKFAWPYPPVNTLIVTADYTTDLSSLLLGAHRLAADIAYIQFLQYYGVTKHDHDHSEHDKHEHVHGETYPLLLEFGRRMARLDPYFHTAILEVAGSLSFNEGRIGESLGLLREAIELDPMYYRYRLYAAGILYKHSGENDKLIDVLAQAVRYPDSPYMLKNVLANLYKKQGRFLESAQMRLLMAQTGPTAAEREYAAMKLEQFLQEHPEIRARLTPP